MAGRGRQSQLDQLDTEVSEVTSLLKDNVEKVMSRGDKLDDLQERSDDLEASSQHFYRASKKLKRKMCCQNAKMTCCIVVVVVVLVAAVILIILLETKPWEHSNKPSGNSTLAATARPYKPSGNSTLAVTAQLGPPS